MLKNITLFVLLCTAFHGFGQRFEMRPNALFSFHNIAKVPAAGLRLEGLIKVKGRHHVYSSIEFMHGEGNRGLGAIEKDALYSYRFDDPRNGQISAYTYLYQDGTLLNVKSARLSQAAFKLGYSYRLPFRKNTLELSAAAYGNYVTGFYIIGVFGDIPNYDPLLQPIDYFVSQYFFNYLDIGPGITARYILSTKRSVDPVFGIDYNYGTQKGSWASVSVGLLLK